jgi:translation initiation factor 4G
LGSDELLKKPRAALIRLESTEDRAKRLKAVQDAKEKEAEEKRIADEKAAAEQAQARKEAERKAQAERMEREAEETRKAEEELAEEERRKAEEAERQRLLAEEAAKKAAEEKARQEALEAEVQRLKQEEVERERAKRMADAAAAAALAAKEAEAEAEAAAAEAEAEQKVSPLPSIPSTPILSHSALPRSALSSAGSTPAKRPFPGHLDLSTANPKLAGPISALASAKVIEDLEKTPYPEGIKSPSPDLNVGAPKGKFRHVLFWILLRFQTHHDYFFHLTE